MTRRRLSLTRLAAAASTVVVLAGCASVSPDGLRGAVQSHTASRLPDGAQLPATDAQAEQAAQERIAQWLLQPLDAEQAVRIALLNNAGLRARLAQLGVEDAERVQALTLPNPALSLSRSITGSEREIGRQLGFDLVSLITLPWRTRWLGLQMEQATLSAAQDVVLLAADTRRAWLHAVTARQQLAAAERMHEAAEAGAELARRMARVGNYSRLQQARELSIQHETAAQLARARLSADVAHEQLARVLGLWGTRTALRLPDQLPAIPQAATALRDGDDAEATALRERLDLRALRLDLDHLADRSGWARLGAMFGDIGLSYSRNTSSGSDTATRGWGIDMPLPLFDWGGAANARARAQVQRSAALLQQGAIRARGEARSSWLRYRTAWDLAYQQQSEVLPLRRFIQEESMLRYNGMLLSTWELLAEARASAQAVATATEAQRDFWLADIDLQLALTSSTPGETTALSSNEASQ
ncbi:type I secretion outer membrane protein, TolC family [Delftia tsuruhatensis]|uniref:TolC family protein n=1 Tax=Delftia tsuruhatensis TaxID=180282 RepID=UPI001E7D5A78|nr:TolC family protein [Delftia tsuruhatensis]CAB5711733.1 type I secretion outer membrane protein, TolC family [Delftia tsuruhatensis]CAC9686918.1 type I secretion outer membrane protein, TolC family [Delftia tsuruhatensis]